MTTTFTVYPTTQPTFEPVTMNELKVHLKISGNAEDSYLESLITAAREFLETYTQRSWCKKTYKMVVTGPVKQIEVPYADETLSNLNITVDSDGNVVITFDAGFANAADIPKKYKQALLIYAASLYENREGEVKMPSAVVNLLASERLHTPLSYVGVI
jgi:hypothetical protein